MAFIKKDFAELYAQMEKEAQLRAPQLTDYHEGSVVRSLFESFAIELAMLYEQLDLVYQAGYVDTAEAANLDRVVAVLGIKRNEPDYATGEVVFTRDPGSNEALIIPAGTLVTTEEDDNQDPPKKAYLTIEEVVLAVGETTVTANVQAESRGREMTTESDTVVVMPRPVPGVKYVSNPRPIRFLGSDRESDDELRQRAKQGLLASGRASNTAIENALLGLPGVRAVRIKEDPQRPGVIQLYVDGLTERNHSLVQQRVDEVRAAGIYAAISPAQPIRLNVVMRIAVDLRIKGEEREAVERQVTDAVEGFLNRLPMGQPLLFAQLTAEVLGVKGVVDLEDFRIAAERRPEGAAAAETTSYTITARRIDAALFERFVPARVRVAAGLKPLRVDAAVQVRLPGRMLVDLLSRRYHDLLGGLQGEQELLASEAVRSAAAEGQAVIVAELQRFYARVQHAAAAIDWAVGLDQELQSQFLAALQACFAAAQQASPAGGGRITRNEILAQLHRQYAAGGGSARQVERLQASLAARLQESAATMLADFPLPVLEAIVNTGAVATYQAAVREAQLAQQKVLLEAEETFRTQTAELDLTTPSGRGQQTKARNKMSAAQTQANEQFAAVEAAAAAARDVALGAAPAQAAALAAEAAAMLQGRLVDETLAVLAAAGSLPLYDLDLRLRATSFDGEVLENVEQVEASFVETPQPANLFVYSHVLELAGRLNLALPAAATAAEQTRAVATVRHAIAAFLEGLHADEEIDLDRLQAAIKARSQATFDPGALVLVKVQGEDRVALPERGDGRKLKVQFGERVRPAPSPWLEVEVEQV